ncbi:MAG TPA: ABC transporter permease [Terriglobales bacterium]|nr:ABC transporter permease [Terriglobales bacterium]
MHGLIQDLRYTFRRLSRAPAFAAVVVLTLAVGIGANTAVFSVIEAVMLRPLPYRNAEKLALLTSDSEDPQGGGFLLKDIDSLRSESHSFSDIAFYYRDSGFSRVTLTGGTEPESVQGAFVSSNLFSVMGTGPALGRVFTSAEEDRREHVVVLSYGLWTRRFGASPDTIGAKLEINRASYQIIGVMPATFRFPGRDQQFWTPITTNDSWDDPSPTKYDPHHGRYFYERWQAVGRLAKDADLARTQVELSTIFSQLSQADADPNRGPGITVAPLRVTLKGNTRVALLVFFIAVVFVLLISCSNVANLVLARNASRGREIAIRAALGAGRGHLLRQLLTESAVLGLLAGTAGLLLASASVRTLISFAPPGIDRIEETRVDGGVLTFTAAVSLLAAMAFGLAPAWKLSRNRSLESLRSGIAWVGYSLRGIRSALVVTEFALAVVLLAGAGLLVRSFLALRAVAPGFEPHDVLTMNVELPSATGQANHAFYDAVLERVRELPGVQAVGEVGTLFELWNINNLGLRALEGRTPEPRERWTPLVWVSVRGDYFQAMGAPLLRGRYFTLADGPHSSLVAIIDESMVRRYWPKEDPVGKHFKGQDTRGQNDDWLTVVGIVGDMRRSGLEKSPIPHVFMPATQNLDGDRTGSVIVRTKGDPRVLASELRSSVRGLSKAAILSGVTTLEQELDEQLSPRHFEASLLGAFSAVALSLAGLGILGLMHYLVAQRRQEIGIRTALGARPQDILRLVLSEATKLAACGVAIGLCAAVLLTRFMATLLFGVRPLDPVTLAAAPILLILVALLASWIPARRATQVDPMMALRQE